MGGELKDILLFHKSKKRFIFTWIKIENLSKAKIRAEKKRAYLSSY